MLHKNLLNIKNIPLNIIKNIKTKRIGHNNNRIRQMLGLQNQYF